MHLLTFCYHPFEIFCYLGVFWLYDGALGFVKLFLVSKVNKMAIQLIESCDDCLGWLDYVVRGSYKWV